MGNMNPLNTVLKVNLKGQGDSLVWLYPKAAGQTREADLSFPTISADLFGPNLGFSSQRISQHALFLTTTSKWNLKDEFGRKGLSLSQGILVSTNSRDSQSISDLCTSFSSLLSMYVARYQTIGELLECLAADGDESRARRLASEMFKPFTDVEASSDSSLIRLLLDYLEDETSRNELRLRVHTSFPWSEYLGFISLLGLQALKNDIRSIGGGPLDSYKPYQCISTPLEVPEFRFVDLSKALNSEQATNQQPETKENADPSKPDRLRNMLSVIAPVASSLVVLCMAFLFLQTNQRILRRLETIAEVNKNTAEEMKEQLTFLVDQKDLQQKDLQQRDLQQRDLQQRDLQQKEQFFLQNIAKMYDTDKAIRLSGIKELLQDQQSHQSIVPLALAYAQQHKENKDGIENTFLVLQACKSEILKKSKNELISFLELVKSIAPKRLDSAERLKKSLDQP